MERKFKIEYGHITGERKNGHDVGVKYTRPIIGEKKAQKELDRLNRKSKRDDSIEYITLWEYKDGEWKVLG